MLELFQESVLWKVLTYFLLHPKTSIYVKQLSRELKISPSGTNRALKLLANAGILSKEEIGKAHYYLLNNNLPFVKSLKTSHFLAVIKNWEIEKKFYEKDESLISLVLYGSYAAGDFDERSDIDVLLISPSTREHFLSLLQEMEIYLNREVSLEVFNISRWRKIKNEETTFYQEIMRNHILLAGNELL